MAARQSRIKKILVRYALNDLVSNHILRKDSFRTLSGQSSKVAEAKISLQTILGSRSEPVRTQNGSHVKAGANDGDNGSYCYTRP